MSQKSLSFVSRTMEPLIASCIRSASDVSCGAISLRQTTSYPFARSRRTVVPKTQWSARISDSDLFHYVDVFVLHQVARKFQAGADVTLGEVGKIVRDDLLKSFPSGSQVQHLRHLNARPRDARLPVTNIRPD